MREPCRVKGRKSCGNHTGRSLSRVMKWEQKRVPTLKSGLVGKYQSYGVWDAHAHGFRNHGSRNVCLGCCQHGAATKT